jgi:membrane associated rhomboid family serine protease
MYSLYSFGSYIEQYFGMGTFLGIYFAGMLGGNLVSLYLHRREPYRALGASGGVCGVIFASIFLLPGGSVYLFFVPIPIPSWLFAIVFVAFSLYGARSQLGHIGHDAHLGGALIGLFTATLIYPAIIKTSPVLFGAIIAITVGMILFFKRKPV